MADDLKDHKTPIDQIEAPPYPIADYVRLQDARIKKLQNLLRDIYDVVTVGQTISTGLLHRVRENLDWSRNDDRL